MRLENQIVLRKFREDIKVMNAHNYQEDNIDALIELNDPNAELCGYYFNTPRFSLNPVIYNPINHYLLICTSSIAGDVKNCIDNPALSSSIYNANILMDRMKIKTIYYKDGTKDDIL